MTEILNRAWTPERRRKQSEWARKAWKTGILIPHSSPNPGRGRFLSANDGRLHPRLSEAVRQQRREQIIRVMQTREGFWTPGYWTPERRKAHGLKVGAQRSRMKSKRRKYLRMALKALKKF